MTTNLIKLGSNISSADPIYVLKALKHNLFYFFNTVLK